MIVSAAETPTTSLAAWREIQERSLLSPMRWRVYDCLVQHGPMTAGEVCAKLVLPNQPHPSYHRRLDELWEMGVAERVQERHCTVTGQLASVWRALDKLPRPLQRKAPTRMYALDLTADESGKLANELVWLTRAALLRGEKPSEELSTLIAGLRKGPKERRRGTQ